MGQNPDPPRVFYEPGAGVEGWWFCWQGNLHGPFETKEQAHSALDTVLREAYECP